MVGAKFSEIDACNDAGVVQGLGQGRSVAATSVLEKKQRYVLCRQYAPSSGESRPASPRSGKAKKGGKGKGKGGGHHHQQTLKLLC